MLVHYSSSPTIKIIQQEIVQFILLILIVATVCLTIFLDVMVLEHGVGERSLTEYYQQILLFSVACSFAYAVKIDKGNRHFHVLVMGFFTCMLIRELDSFFDQIVHGFWLYPALLVFVTCSLYASRNNRGTLEGLAQFTRHRNFQSIVTALVIILIFSRLFGMGELWKAILADNYIRLAKNIVEEGTELLGYSLLFFSSIGYVRSLPHRD
ncbi:MAG: hypothetical protein HRT97_09680 [Moritella sp.]|uniref:hypothetical protein n=1 Tax=Moritella sp. TaxID=78556 RepID=UPI0025E5F173|nr:hypothetical protein [Moritella sp.]NQZ92597.1 hypothetical protein [Moritella sp.]